MVHVAHFAGRLKLELQAPPAGVLEWGEGNPASLRCLCWPVDVTFAGILSGRWDDNGLIY